MDIESDGAVADVTVSANRSSRHSSRIRIPSQRLSESRENAVSNHAFYDEHEICVDYERSDEHEISCYEISGNNNNDFLNESVDAANVNSSVIHVLEMLII
jgi:hypothetical protein